MDKLIVVFSLSIGCETESSTKSKQFYVCIQINFDFAKLCCRVTESESEIYEEETQILAERTLYHTRFVLTPHHQASRIVKDALTKLLDTTEPPKLPTLGDGLFFVLFQIKNDLIWGSLGFVFGMAGSSARDNFDFFSDLLELTLEKKSNA